MDGTQPSYKLQSNGTIQKHPINCDPMDSMGWFTTWPTKPSYTIGLHA